MLAQYKICWWSFVGILVEMVWGLELARNWIWISGRSDVCAAFPPPRNTLRFTAQASIDSVFVQVQDLFEKCWCFPWCSHSRPEFCIPFFVCLSIPGAASHTVKKKSSRSWQTSWKRHSWDCSSELQRVGTPMTLRWSDSRGRLWKGGQGNSSQNNVVVQCSSLSPWTSRF